MERLFLTDVSEKTLVSVLTLICARYLLIQSDSLIVVTVTSLGLMMQYELKEQFTQKMYIQSSSPPPDDIKPSQEGGEDDYELA